MKLFVYPYTTGSESAKLVANKLDALRIKLSDSTYQHKPGNLIVNWGNTNCPFTENCLNPGQFIKDTVDKLKFFRLMTRAGLSGYLPVYWTHPDDIPDEAFPVMCRTTTTGCDGAGIVVAVKRSELVPASLYTKVIGDAREYRVTLFRDEVTDIQTKLPRAGQEAHPLIHTYANGWGFRRVPVEPVIENKIVQAAKATLAATKLDFGGIDILYVNGRAYVLEINTAMGLEGDALNRFCNAVEKYAATLDAPAPAVSNEVANSAGSLGLDAVLAGYLEARDWRRVAIRALELAA